MLEFHNPIPPPGSTVVRLKGLKYLEASLDIEVQQYRVAITLRKPGTYDLKLKRNNTSGPEISEEILQIGVFPLI